MSWPSSTDFRHAASWKSSTGSHLLENCFILRNGGCTCKASGSPASGITRVFDVIWSCLCFYSGSLDSVHVQVGMTAQSYSCCYFSLSLFLCSSPSFVIELSFNYSSCCFCGTLWLPLRRTAATGLTAPGSRLSTFFFSPSLSVW